MFKIFRDALPDEFLVWHEPSTLTRKPDFILLSPNYGLLVVEVKDWNPEMIIDLEGGEFILQRSGIPVPSEENPLRQAEKHKDALVSKLKSKEILLHGTGKYQGRLAFPIGRAACLTSISHSDLISSLIIEHYGAESFLFKEDILRWQQYGEEEKDREITRAFQGLFDSRAKFPFEPLTEDQIRTIKGVLYPSFVIREEPAKPDSWKQKSPVPQGAKILKVLDHGQELEARRLGSGHRIISGIAGSGKTLILINRARWLVQQNPKTQALVLCFNITLAAYLRSTINTSPLPSPNIEVMHYHEWARLITGKRLPTYQDRDENEVDDAIFEMVLSALKDHPEKRWDCILVDEAHLLHPTWFTTIRMALKDEKQGNLLIVSDVNQKLKKRKRFKWKDMEIQAVGRSRILRTNYRNTKQVLESAWSILETRLPEDDEADETFPAVAPSGALRTGSKVELVVSSGQTEFQNNVHAWLNSLLGNGITDNQIALLYRKNFRRTKPVEGLITFLEDKGHECYWVSKNNDSKRAYSVSRSGVRIITTQSALGLEFKAVGVLWVDQYDTILKMGHDEQVSALKEFYVGMTRTQEYLALFGIKGQALTHYLIENSNTFSLDIP